MPRTADFIRKLLIKLIWYKSRFRQELIAQRPEPSKSIYTFTINQLTEQK